MGRWVWCRAIAEQRARHARGEKYAGYAEMCRWLTVWRNAPETTWLAQGPIHPQQQVLRRLDQAYRRFFAAAKAGDRRLGAPGFKCRGQEPGLRFPDPAQFVLDQENGRIKLPKLGWLRLRLSQPVVGVLRNVSIVREGARWFCSIQVEYADEAEPVLGPPTLGIDVGVVNFAACSDGTIMAPLKALDRQHRRLKRYQRAVSRKRKGSANRRKAVVRLANLHRCIARQRRDWLHKLSTALAQRHAVVAIEELRIASMSASARGCVAAPGRNVRQKSGLNRSILDAAWGEFARQLDYKLDWRGGRAVRVDPAYLSRTCRLCGHESKDNRRTQALFRCVACGHAEHADVHAAKNILAAGHAVWAQDAALAACGEAVRREAAAMPWPAASVKQEPTEVSLMR
jgi:putative transposase